MMMMITSYKYVRKIVFDQYGPPNKDYSTLFQQRRRKKTKEKTHNKWKLCVSVVRACVRRGRWQYDGQSGKCSKVHVYDGFDFFLINLNVLDGSFLSSLQPYYIESLN